MCDSNLGNKVRILTQLLNQNQNDQCQLLITLARLLEDKEKEKVWNVMAARKMILAALETHHPNVDTTKATEQWRQDHKEANEKLRKDRDKSSENRIIPYFS